MRYVSRTRWGARRRGATPRTHPLPRPRGVTLHWEGTGLGKVSHSRCAGIVRGIEAFHRDGRGWADIAYNLLVCPHGYVFEGRGLHTKSAANGNTTANAWGYAVCWLGGPGDAFGPDSQAALVDAVLYLRAKGGAGLVVNGHRDHKSTQCPGDTIYRWLRAQEFTRKAKPLNHVQLSVTHIAKAIRELEQTPARRVVVRGQLAILRRVVAILRRTDPIG